MALVSHSRWTDDTLDCKRRVCDEPADCAITLWKHRDGKASIRPLAEKLVGFEDADEIDQLINLLSTSPSLAQAIDPCRRRRECTCTHDELAAGERLFEEHGLKILMVLVFYSLPSAYAAQSGVRVLHSRNGATGYFVKDLNRRLVETTQFVIDVLTPGALEVAPASSAHHHGLAVRSALRVRLLHAAVRSLIEAHTPPWEAEELGRPINQEDMAGTLLTFSWIVVDGLRRLRLDISDETAEAYFGIWRKVGALLGVDPDLIPANLVQATELMERIKSRQIDAPIRLDKRNQDGIEITARLLEFTREALPAPLRWRRLPASVMRFFLPPDVATSLGVPRTPILDWLVKVWFFFEAKVTRFKFYDVFNRMVFKEWGARDARARSLLQFSRFFNRRLVDRVQRFDRNEPLKDGHRPGRVDLREWKERWALDQADFITRGVRQLRKVGRRT
jgi:hypothetical protein